MFMKYFYILCKLNIIYSSRYINTECYNSLKKESSQANYDLNTNIFENNKECLNEANDTEHFCNSCPILDVTQQIRTADNESDAQYEIKKEILSESFSNSEEKYLEGNAKDFHNLGNKVQKNKKQMLRYHPYKKRSISVDLSRNYSSETDTHFYCNKVEKQRTSDIDKHQAGLEFRNDTSDEHYNSTEQRKTPDFFLKSEVVDPLYIDSDSDTKSFLESSSTIDISKIAKLKLEIATESLEHKLDLLKKQYQEKIINTKGKSYAVLNESRKELFSSDIQTFISGDFYIDANYLQKDPTPFFDLIDSVAGKEENFWHKSGNPGILRNTGENMLECVEKINLCNDDSPIFTYYPGLIHIKHFIKNIILNDINLVKNSCLWIFLLKFVQSLSMFPLKNKNLNPISSGKNCCLQYNEYDAYNGDKYIFTLIRSQYELFDTMARHIFKKTEIFPGSTHMLDFINKSLYFNNKDIHISLGKHIGYIRVITDCILRMSPNTISIFILQMEKQKLINLNGGEFRSEISTFFWNISHEANILNDESIVDFQIIYKRIVLAYIDFFKHEALQVEFSKSKNARYSEHINFTLFNLFKPYCIEKLLINELNFKFWMQTAEALCVLFNFFLKCELNPQAYTDSYGIQAFVECNKRLKFIQSFLIYQYNSKMNFKRK
ncbi:hypothetical protein CWI38_0017p0040 [Hamiltosporidium tvaerminnensis]|uniref:Uncharacterized protein n=3 Tax=Hamiltosporidium tvaerminnensis TaxID=1176355 RepID=A0A4V2JYE4_9MICR|nr:hypothetical protein CWI38_0017p0040 [Hamiltosporidium tvaerminnensis]